MYLYLAKWKLSISIDRDSYKRAFSNFLTNVGSRLSIMLEHTRGTQRIFNTIQNSDGKFVQLPPIIVSTCCYGYRSDVDCCS
jgi:hypothetical protein